MPRIGDDEFEVLARTFCVPVEQLITFLKNVEIRFERREDGETELHVLRGAIRLASYEVEPSADCETEHVVRHNYYWNPAFLHLVRECEEPRQEWSEYGAGLLLQGEWDA